MLTSTKDNTLLRPVPKHILRLMRAGLKLVLKSTGSKLYTLSRYLLEIRTRVRWRS